MKRIGQTLFVISAASAYSMGPVEYPGSYPRPILRGIPPPRDNLIPADYTPPSYRVPLLATHRMLIDTFTVVNDYPESAWTLEGLLRALNFTVSLHPPRPPLSDSPYPFSEAYHLLAFPGSNTSNSSTHSPHNRVLLTAHINTHPNWFPYALNTTYIPPDTPVDFAALHPATYIVGRGAVDAKAAMAAQVVAMRELVAAGAVDGESVALLFVSNGHNRCCGGATARRLPGERARAVIVGEPTGGRLACGVRGCVKGWIEAVGREEGLWKMISGVFRRGEGGRRKMEEVVGEAVRRVSGRGFGGSERFGETRVDMGEVRSGDAIRGVMPEFATVHIKVKVAGGDWESGAGMVVNEIRRVVREGEGGERLTVYFNKGYGPVASECGVKGFETMIADPGTDLPYFEGNYVPYLYGPGSAHPPEGYEEGLTVKELEDAVEGYKRLIMHALESPFPPPRVQVETCPIR